VSQGAGVTRTQDADARDTAARFGAATPLWMLAAVVIAIVSVLVYTVFAAPKVTPQASEAVLQQRLQDRAELAAARVAAGMTEVQSALGDGVSALSRAPSRPLDAAEIALKSAPSQTAAVAVMKGSSMAAVAGAGDRARWSDVATAAEASKRTTWIGADPEFVYVSRKAGGDLRLIAAMKAITLPHADHDLVIVAGSEGRVLASSEPGWAGRELTAFGMRIDDARAAAKRGGPIGATLPGMGETKAVAVTDEAGSVVALAAKRPASALDGVIDLFVSLLPVLAPLTLTGLMLLLMLMQARRIESARRAYIETERRFRTAVEAARCGIWEWDLKLNEVQVSDLMAEMLGVGGVDLLDGDEVLGRVAPDHRAQVLAALKNAALYGGFDVTFRVPGFDGRSTWIDARGQAAQDERGDFVRIVGVALDVTEEKTAQARAQRAERRLKDAIESVEEAFALWDARDRLLLSNQNFREWFAIDARALAPGAARETVLQIARVAIVSESMPADGRPGVREAELHDGRWLQISERRTADGGTVLTAADITAIKRQEAARARNEEQLQQIVSRLEISQSELAVLARKYEIEKTRAEAANRAKSEFLANMSHELRTPLNAINGFSEIMVGEMYGALGDRRYKEYAQDILMSGQHLLALINDILDMAKIEAGKLALKFEAIALEEVAEDVARLMRNRAEEAGLDLAIEVPHLPDVEADYRAVKQILLNLVSNAVKFTPRGGRVTVRARTEFDHVELSVKDTGIGISREDLDRLAKPFEQVETQHAKTQQGTGLGLALTKALIEMHGGRMVLDSEPGMGTTVAVILPMIQTDRRVAA
jgi:two-component system cell cycle sensor histidine kinase PleC